MQKRDTITFAPIIPLIGGKPLGVSDALGGKNPEYVLSYEAFGGHDKHYLKYLRENRGFSGEYVVIDSEERKGFRPAQVDIVSSTCPCKGLSSFSTIASADSPVVEWMYNSAEYVLSQVQPKVFFGENAPRLFSNFGKKVADKLHAIGQKYGYSLNLYYTEGKFHGSCQKRPRTFYFFTKGDRCPIFPFFHKEPELFEDCLNKEIRPDDPMNLLINANDPKEDPFVAYAMHIQGAKNLRELTDSFSRTENLICGADTQYGEGLLSAAKWMEENGFPKGAKKCRQMQGKLDDKKGYWGHGVTTGKGIIPSLIGVLPGSLINPYTEKFLTLRDALRLMKMPDDFNLASENPVRESNHICQNVSPTTAYDMTLAVIDFLEGKCDVASSSYIKQNNKKKTWESVLETPGNDFGEFLSLHA